MRLLAFDCALAAVSAALLVDGAPLAAERQAMQRGQAETLLPMLARLLGRAGLRLDQLDAIATTIGPGSYTGVRIGLAAAAGLSLGLDLPVFGVTTLEALAAEAQANERLPVMVVIESQRADLFVQNFAADGGALDAPHAMLPDELRIPAGPLLLAGDGAARIFELLRPAAARLAPGTGTPDPVWVARLAARRIAAAPELGRSRALPEPLYLRAPLATPLAGS